MFRALALWSLTAAKIRCRHFSVRSEFRPGIRDAAGLLSIPDVFQDLACQLLPDGVPHDSTLALTTRGGVELSKIRLSLYFC